MSEPKDPAIKLFGKTIPLPEGEIPDVPLCCGAPSSFGGCEADTDLEHQDPDLTSLQDSRHESLDKSIDGGQGCDGSIGKDRENEQEILEENVPGCKQEDRDDSPNTEANSGLTENTETSVIEKDSSSSKPEGSEAEEEQNGTAGSQETKLKKPDQILPCPRCNSMDTKFCYYNNYNVNQPRHFCKNCQRYWTAGGTMRNVPVGAGRRKNKNSVSQYRHITVNAGAMQNRSTDFPNGIQNANASILTFGSDALLCQSMASSLNLADKAKRNGFHEPEQPKIPNPFDNSNRSPNPGAISGFPQNASSCLPKVPCFPGAPGWSYPWSSVPWTVLPFYPLPAYWNCPVPPGTWSNAPWIAQPSSPSGSASNSPRLGKHLRDEESMTEPGKPKEVEAAKEKKSAERNLWVPKTLRVDDPDEAAKSSIWETLGIKNEKADTFGAFNRLGNEGKIHVGENCPSALQANPAALSRSANFHETS